MKGPEHYVMAERLSESATQPGLESEWVAARLARAQVHATLALAAATAGARMAVPQHDGSTATFLLEDGAEWAEATS